MSNLHAPPRRRRAALLVTCTLAALLWEQAAGGPYRPREGSSSPIVTITSGAAAPRAVEARMAKFILLLQANDRAAAARLLSRRVPATYRRSFLSGKWLKRESTQDFALVYFLPAIRVRVLGISRPRAVVRVEPLTPHVPRSMAIGFIDVPMYYENGRWQVNPSPVAVRRNPKPAARRT